VASPIRSRLVAVLVTVALTAVTTAGLGRFWSAIGGGPLSLHGWIAMTLGIGGTAALAGVLMALAFRSDRDGWDARADRLPGDDAKR
tara:strand:- start:105910 stop:106170 length:261 start_codon:yes stop_codon:yes gene_type:complete